MKINKLLLGLGAIATLSMASCSNDEPLTPTPDGPNDDSRFMAVTIRNANGGSRADGVKYENGNAMENEVKSLRFYFFDENGDAVAIDANGINNYYDADATTDEVYDKLPTDKEEGSDTQIKDPNIEKKLKAVIVINTKDGNDNVKKLKKMVAVLNSADLPDGPKKLGDLRAIAENYGASYITASTDNSVERPTAYNGIDNENVPAFVMSNSTFASEDYKCEVEVKQTDIKTDEETAMKNPVEIYVERVMAKVRVTTNWTSAMTLREGVTYKGTTYTAVELKENTDSKPNITFDGKQVYVIFTGWCPTGLTPDSYLFKKVNSDWSLGWNWQDAAFHRSYWAENSCADQTTSMTYKYFSHAAATGKLGFSKTEGTGETITRGDWFYIPENAATKDNNGEKATYKPSESLSNRTQVYLGALLVTVADDGTATPVEIAEWGGTKYTSSDLKKAMLEVIKDQVFICTGSTTDTSSETTGEGTTETTTTTWTYSSLTEDMVKFKSNTEIDNTLYDAENDRRYLAYLQVDEAAIKDKYSNWNGKFYKTKLDKNPETLTDEEAAANVMTEADVNSIFTSMPGAMVWQNGKTYYYVDIENLAKGGLGEADFATKGGIGVVRNTVYDVNLNTVYGLGTPVFNPINGEGKEENIVIIPQKPSPEYAFIGARINILSWRVVSQNAELDW